MSHPQSELSQLIHTLSVETLGAGFVEITRPVARWLAAQGAHDGLLTLFIRHTSASLVIQENADPDVQTDLHSSLERFAPRSGHYVHATEGPDDMPAHIKTMLTDVSLSVPVAEGRLMLGTWQGIYVAEHRDRPHTRSVVLHFLGTIERSLRQV